MQPIHLLRVVFGLALRLGLSGAFLLSSASLAVAASLLLYTATEGVGGHRTWLVAADTNATPLGAKQDVEPTAPLTLRAGWGPAGSLRYSAAEVISFRSPIPGPGPTQLLASGTDPDLFFPTPLDAAKTTVQRSWATIKSTFR